MNEYEWKLFHEVDPNALIRHYDKDGNQISLWQMSQLHEDMEYVRVAVDTVGPYWISTVWLGIDHNWTRAWARPGDDERPLIFETMVFAGDLEHDETALPQDLDCQRYCTEAEAIEGHNNMVTLIRATTMTEEDVLGLDPAAEALAADQEPVQEAPCYPRTCVTPAC